MVDGFFHFFGSAGVSATMSLFSSQYMTSSSPRFLQASAAKAPVASTQRPTPASAGTNRFNMEIPPKAVESTLAPFSHTSLGPTAPSDPVRVAAKRCDNPRPMKMPLQVAILAAGEGKRMRSARPKVLHPLAGRPMLAHVLQAVRKLEPRAICVVYGSGGDQVRSAIAGADLRWAKQEVLLGTGDALKCALEHLPADGVTLAMIGDLPLIRPQTLSRLAAAVDGDMLAVLTAMPPD